MASEDSGKGDAGAVRTLSIGVPPDELLQAWRDPAVQRRVMAHFAELVEHDGGRMRWRASGVHGLEWEMHEAEFVPGSSVSHRGDQDASVGADTRLTVRPAPADFGTEATLRVDYRLPGGALGEAAAKLFGAAPDMLAAAALRRFKSLVETGEIPSLARNPSARPEDHQPRRE
ncbi:MAG TPA: hypothetical protein VK325_09955 [Pseudoxanthomonas sp.]|nr:hypothetical protein [Pseudoxanthomonas sp.]